MNGTSPITRAALPRDRPCPLGSATPHQADRGGATPGPGAKARPREASQRHGEREELGGPRAARPQRTTPVGPARQTPQVGNHCLRAGGPGWRAVGGMTGSSRGLRGGNWNNNAFNLSSSNRNTNDPSNENNNIGFRLASPCRLTQARSGGVWEVSSGRSIGSASCQGLLRPPVRRDFHGCHIERGR